MLRMVGWLKIGCDDTVAAMVGDAVAAGRTHEQSSPAKLKTRMRCQLPDARCAGRCNRGAAGAAHLDLDAVLCLLNCLMQVSQQLTQATGACGIDAAAAAAGEEDKTQAARMWLMLQAPVMPQTAQVRDRYTQHAPPDARRARTKATIAVSARWLPSSR